jgi:homoserine trans-succinylase
MFTGRPKPIRIKLPDNWSSTVIIIIIIINRARNPCNKKLGCSQLLVSKHYTTATYYRGADKFFARPTSRFILFDGENISFGASLVIYIKSNNIPPIMIINRIHETQHLLSL